MFDIVLFALLGDAVFIKSFPPITELDLRLPEAPAQPRISPANTPITPPADLMPPRARE